MNELKTYTATDIQRYHSGQLPAAERHALEKAALSDPFLADALEGYTTAKTPAADLTVLQQRLQRRIEKEKTKRNVFYLNTWMKIAASIVLIGGAAWLFFQTKNNRVEQLTGRATVQKESPLVKIDNTLDSTSVVYNNVPQTSTPIQIEKEKHSASQLKSADAATEPAPGNNAYRMPATSYVAPAARADSASNKDLALAEVTVDRKKEDAAFKNSAAAPLQGRTSGLIVTERKAADVMDKKSAPASVYKSNGYIATSKDTIKNFNVTMRSTELPADETVVLNTKPKEQRARKMNISIDSTEPAEGWVRFDDYLAQNLKEPEELKTKGLHGEVELSFEINKEGEAVNIAVTKSLCDKCDEEAVRLLKEGPKWKKNKKKGKVKINFTPNP